ncbi:MAG: CAP domain-containing protein, partial [Clostridia bacterium]|nr:CAP domain-containing protein [Clostridia bacterium]
QASESQPSAAQPSAAASQPTAVDQSGMASQAISATNSERVSNGLPALATDADLSAAAQIRAREIAQVFDHTRPDGSSWYTVSGKAAGENIASGYTSASSVVTAWMNSQGHRDNILDSSFTSIGMACVQIGGVYYWVQLFGR